MDRNHLVLLNIAGQPRRLVEYVKNYLGRLQTETIEERKSSKSSAYIEVLNEIAHRSMGLSSNQASAF
jgi:hypothetical protein